MSQDNDEHNLKVLFVTRSSAFERRCLELVEPYLPVVSERVTTIADLATRVADHRYDAVVCLADADLTDGVVATATERQVPLLLVTKQADRAAALDALGRGEIGERIPEDQLWRIVPALAREAFFRQRLSAAKSEKEDAEAKLLHAQRLEAVGRLAGGVAHDFNNLLTAILSFGSFLRGAMSPNDPRFTDVQEVLIAADRASALTRQLLIFSRRQATNPKPLDLNELIRGLYRLLRRTLGEHIELVTLLHGAPIGVRVDAGQLEQVVVNLAVNARDAMDEGGKLTIQTVKRGDSAILRVSDTGPGVSDEVREHIFEPFVTTKSASQGTGLGLATCYGIVKQAEGDIRLLSNPDGGAVFEVELPLLRGTLAAALQDDSEVPEVDLRGTETILIAEDEATIRRIITRVLSSHGYSVLAADTGGEALRIEEEYDGQIHLLLTDVIMPHMGGRELAQEMAVRRPGTRVLFLSGYTDSEQSIVECLEGSSFLAKPFNDEQLLLNVRRAIHRGRLTADFPSTRLAKGLD